LLKINIAIGSPCRFCCPGKATQSSRILAFAWPSSRRVWRCRAGADLRDHL